MSSSNEAVGNRIKEARVAKGMSQAALAQEVNILPTTLYKIEIGQSAPSLDQLKAMGRALGVTAAWLAFGDE